jgi:hypothetical protein
MLPCCCSVVAVVLPCSWCVVAVMLQFCSSLLQCYCSVSAVLLLLCCSFVTVLLYVNTKSKSKIVSKNYFQAATVPAENIKIDAMKALE